MISSGWKPYRCWSLVLPCHVNYQCKYHVRLWGNAMQIFFFNACRDSSEEVSPMHITTCARKTDSAESIDWTGTDVSIVACRNVFHLECLRMVRIITTHPLPNPHPFLLEDASAAILRNPTIPLYSTGWFSPGSITAPVQWTSEVYTAVGQVWNSLSPEDHKHDMLSFLCSNS